ADNRPPRLLGTSVRALVPELIEDEGERSRAEAFIASYRQRFNEQPDMINMLAKVTVDVAGAILNEVEDPSDYASVKKYLEENVVETVINQKFSPTNHVGVDASSVAIVELKDRAWTVADPIE